MTNGPTPREQEKYGESPAFQPEEHPAALGFADGVCPECGSDEFDTERHWRQPALSIYFCRCGAWDHIND